MTAAPRTTVNHHTILINGHLVPSTTHERIDVVNPSTEDVVGSVPAGSVEDVDAAVRAARAALSGWADLPPAARAHHLTNLSRALSERADEAAGLIVAELGMPLDATLDVQVHDAANFLRGYADAITTVPWQETISNSTVLREPVGVVAAITPWNYPLYQITAKAGAALAAGCTVVVKPSELAPLSSYVLAQAAIDADLPPGVFNIVMGTGTSVGEALVSHPLVDMVSFTGSTAAGRRVAQLAGAAPKPVSLELGGKSATVVLDDADLERVIPLAVADCFRNSGQACSARTRLLVPAAHADKVAQLAARAAESTQLGAPEDHGDHLGPLVSQAQRDRVRGYIRAGIAEGARLVTGGPEQPAETPLGYYVKPTVFDQVRNDMTMAREEIFGPVLAIIPYQDQAHAVWIANDSAYGLSAAVWSTDQHKALNVARQLDTGEVYVNGGRFNPAAPFGGAKQSGYGRELGMHGILEFTRLKSVHQ